MFRDKKDILIIIILFLFGSKLISCSKEKECSCLENEGIKIPRDTFNSGSSKEVVYNEYTERAFEQNPDMVQEFYGG